MSHSGTLRRAILSSTTAAILVVGPASPAMALDTPERVYAHNSCKNYGYLQQGYTSYDECFDALVAEYRRTCVMDEELDQCFS